MARAKYDREIGDRVRDRLDIDARTGVVIAHEAGHERDTTVRVRWDYDGSVSSEVAYHLDPES